MTQSNHPHENGFTSPPKTLILAAARFRGNKYNQVPVLFIILTQGMIAASL
jgi:hypothetical protein